MYSKIDRGKLEEKLANDDVKLIEVLDPEQYRDKHIAGAINIPLSDIGKEATQRFDTDQEIVVYCADSNCQASPKAAEKLDELGFEDVYDYAGGKKDWEQAGKPLEGKKAPE